MHSPPAPHQHHSTVIRTPDLQRLPIQYASPALVAEAVAAATNGVEHLFSTTLRTNMVARAHVDCPEPLELLIDTDGPVGWVGLVVYPERAATWETTTFFAPRLRGTGLFGWAKCWQAHAFAALADDSDQDLRLVTSIAPTNTRSVDASAHYALAHGWPSGRLVDEPHKGRTGWVVEWPDDLTHTCTR